LVTLAVARSRRAHAQQAGRAGRAPRADARARRAGEKLSEIVGNMTAVAEGVLTSRSAHALAQRLGVEAPIIEGIFRVIHEGADPVAVVTEVMRRGPEGAN